MTAPFPVSSPPPSLGPEPGATSKLADVWRNLIPWADINAKGIPERYLSLGSEILPVLALQSAMGPDGPHLVNTDVNGNLIADATPHVLDVLAKPVAKGATVFFPLTPKLYMPGTKCMISTAGFVNPSHMEVVQIYQVNNDGSVTFQTGMVYDHNAGDPVVLLPTITLIGRQLWKKQYNFLSNSSPAVGLAAGITINPPVGYKVRVDQVAASLASDGAANIRVQLQVWDGAAGVGGLLFGTRLGINAAALGVVDRFYAADMDLICGTNNQCDIVFNNFAANVLETINVGGWFSNEAGQEF